MFDGGRAATANDFTVKTNQKTMTTTGEKDEHIAEVRLDERL